MKIIKTSKELTAQDKYFLTMAPSVQKMKDQVSQRIEVAKWCVYEDKNSKDEDQTILSIATPENEIFATNSKTFMDDFSRMVDIFAEDGIDVTAIKVISGKSNAGREFITCVYAGQEAETMRKIKKIVTVLTVVRYMYNRSIKEEVTETLEVVKGEEMPPLPENHILIEQQTVSTKEVTYSMTPAEFVKHATVE